VLLTTDEERELRTVVNAHTAPYAKVVRARMVPSAYNHPESNHQQSADEAGCTRRSVRRWRKRWAETRRIEDLPRPGASRRSSSLSVEGCVGRTHPADDTIRESARALESTASSAERAP